MIPRDRFIADASAWWDELRVLEEEAADGGGPRRRSPRSDPFGRAIGDEVADDLPGLLVHENPGVRWAALVHYRRKDAGAARALLRAGIWPPPLDALAQKVLELWELADLGEGIELRFAGTVHEIDFLRAVEEPLLVAGVDARWLLIIDIDTVSEATAAHAIVGLGRTAFAFHSPTHTFLSFDDARRGPIGKRLGFRVSGRRYGPRWRFHDIASAHFVDPPARRPAEHDPAAPIERGHGWGQVVLGALRSEIDLVLGAPREVLAFGSFDKAVYADGVNVWFSVADDRACTLELEAAFTGRTREGIGIGSTIADVLGTHGAPTFRYQDERVTFGDIHFEITDGSVAAISVRRGAR